MENIDLSMRFKKGGEDELIEVMNIYSDRLLKYATTILCDKHEAEDVVQECFISAYENRLNFDGKNLSAWLYKITYNISMNKIKKRKLLYFSNIFIKDTHDINYKEDYISDEILFSLKKIKPKDRALIYGRVIEELSYKELSNQMGVSEVVLRKRYERAKVKLAREINKLKEVNYEKLR